MQQLTPNLYVDTQFSIPPAGPGPYGCNPGFVVTSEGMAVSTDGPVETDAAADDGESASVGNGVAATMTTGVGVLVAVKGGLGVLVGVGVSGEWATALYPIASPSMITSPAIARRKTHATNKALLRKLIGNCLSNSE